MCLTMEEDRRDPVRDNDAPNASWTVDEPCCFLKKRGGRLSGRKADLVER